MVACVPFAYGNHRAFGEHLLGEHGPGGRCRVIACLNGAATRAEHPAVPLTPRELADSARSVATAGAQAVHIHPRSASGAQSLAPSDVLPAVAAIRAASGLPVGVTTGIWTVSGDVSRRLALVGGWTGPDKPDFASINVNEPGIDDLADLLTRELGIPVEAGVWTVDDVDLLAASSLARGASWILLEPASRVGSVAVSVAAAASSALHALGITVPQVHHGYGLATWDVIRWAVTAGFDIRVGLEDTTVLPDGTVASANEDLVAAAARLAGGHGTAG
jgi:uncharacterized protein (DUF849 family)